MTSEAIPVSLHGPAHGTPGKEIQHDCDIEPAFRSPDIGEIGQPLLVRPVRLEVPVEDIVGDDRAFAIILGRPTPLRSGSHGVLPHQALDPVQPAGQPVLEPVAPDPTGAIGAVAGLETLVDLHDELRVVARPGADRSPESGVEARPRDAQHVAHPADRPDMPMLRNESERHVASRAK